MNGELAQLGERLVCNQEVTGSIPVFSTSIFGMLPAATVGPAARIPMWSDSSLTFDIRLVLRLRK